jgi:adenine-specific DNA-methyltransferase
MAKKAAKKASGTARSVESITHTAERRTIIPTAELEAVVRPEDKRPREVRYPRNADLDPQLMWRGKDEQNWTDLVVKAPPLYIQEKVHPKALIDDLQRQMQSQQPPRQQQMSLFSDFNGVPEGVDKTEFYQHDQNWTNRMILGDSLQVMASLAEREELRGKVQCIYFDPPYGIKFNSNFQWSTTSRDVKDGNVSHITREPEQVKAFRDTWRDGIHSYLTYLRDRLTVARDLLTESGSIFVQIGDENVHRVRALMDEVFGEANCVAEIAFVKTTGLTTNFLSSRFDFLLWYAKSKHGLKFRRPYITKSYEDGTADTYTWMRNDAGDYRAIGREQKEAAEIPAGYHFYKPDNITSQGNALVEFAFEGCNYSFRSKTPLRGLARLARAGRIHRAKNSVQYVRKLDDFAVIQVSQLWSDTGTGNFTDEKLYVVQTGIKTIQRCILMATDPGDLVLDPTCGSGTTATVAEQWGRRWITIDTSRVALALARARLMGARYPYYLLADSRDGQIKEAEVSRSTPSSKPAYNDIRHGFVYERVPHITLKSIANNADIDVIWEKYQERLEPLRQQLNAAQKKTWQEWEIPREVNDAWPPETRKVHSDWWQARIARQQEIDKSIAAKAEFEYLYDKPYEDRKKVRVAGPFTVESLSPHRMLGVNDDDSLIDPLQLAEAQSAYRLQSFDQMILENLRRAGVQQPHRENRIRFSSLTPWPGRFVCAEGKWSAVAEPDAAAVPGSLPSPAVDDTEAAEVEKRAAIFIGPEFGTVSRSDLVAAAREAVEAGFDVLIACAFNFEAHTTEFSKLGRIPVLKARMNADLHMGEDLKSTGSGNLFVIFGEPDIVLLQGGSAELRGEVSRVQAEQLDLASRLRDLLQQQSELQKKLKAAGKAGKSADGARPAAAVAADQTQLQLEQELTKLATQQARLHERTERNELFVTAAATVPDGECVVRLFGVDIFKPQTGEVVSNNTDGIACWFIDTDYNEESFFVRHAYFLGQSDPYKSLKTTLKAEISEDAWATLNSDTSRPFAKPTSGRIAVKVINHLGDEVMKVFRVK